MYWRGRRSAICLKTCRAECRRAPGRLRAAGSGPADQHFGTVAGFENVAGMRQVASDVRSVRPATPASARRGLRSSRRKPWPVASPVAQDRHVADHAGFAIDGDVARGQHQRLDSAVYLSPLSSSSPDVTCRLLHTFSPEVTRMDDRAVTSHHQTASGRAKTRRRFQAAAALISTLITTLVIRACMRRASAPTWPTPFR